MGEGERVEDMWGERGSDNYYYTDQSKTGSKVN